MNTSLLLLFALSISPTSEPTDEAEPRLSFGPQLVMVDFDALGAGVRLTNHRVFESAGLSFNAHYFGEYSGSPSKLFTSISLFVPLEVDEYIDIYVGVSRVHMRTLSDRRDTVRETGFGVFGGIMFPLGRVPTFTEFQYSTTGDGSLTLSFGLMFSR